MSAEVAVLAFMIGSLVKAVVPLAVGLGRDVDMFAGG